MAAAVLTVVPVAQTPSPQASAVQGQTPQASATQAPAGWDRNWPAWRGPAGIGISTTANPPTEWSETKNIRWKVEIAGRGHSSPIVWGDRVYVTTAVPVGVAGDTQHAPRGTLAQRGVHRFVVMALDRKTGKTVWERTVKETEPHERSHVDHGTWASGSPFTDGERLFAYFESFGLYALDLKTGTVVWEKDLGDKRMRNEFGEGSTPALHGNTIVLVWDNLNAPSFITALDKRDGKQLWRKDRKEIDTWATPLVLTVNGRPQAIVPAMERVRSYDLATGDIVWESKGLTMNPIPSPVHADGLVFLMAGFRGNDLKAVRVADAKGDIDGTPAIAWTFDRDTPYVPSPIVVDNVLYFLKSNSGILSAFDAKTGKPLYQNQRLEGVPNVFASPVSARGRIYFPGQDGGTMVIKTGPAFEVLATNTLDDGFDASPALVDDELFLRGRKFLYAIAAQ